MSRAVCLRLVEEHDAAALQRIYAPYVRETAVSFELEPPTLEQIVARIRATLPMYPWLVCERDGEVVGYAYANRYRERAAYRWSVEVTIYVAPAHQRRGIGRALYTALLRILALQGYCNAFAAIALPNPASVALHEALGFTSVGVYRSVGYKLGRWYDVGWWQRSLQLPTPLPPPPPLPLAQVCATPAWQATLDAALAGIRP
ncbi:arsinothricin resistance N-acetyltransferase ArsN1 family B [Kallotenue papyrolyticum]|uniref:arsinothricin resistance N-acetyltransferase ArsN1 family B n=1 Tax=Kallotenue papyrolyticum TaxID=1325125 RepID=UPI0004926099|nr:arsinothricin resistance N-acetyltransferase ArsN1 family B [Kallotenue papyrolyticum]